jgi:uncharacterized protein YdeI (BOF family)
MLRRYSAAGRPPSPLLVLCLGALLVISGCGNRPQTTLGEPISDDAAQVVAVGSLQIREDSDAAARVTLAGEMVEKCPVAGCWFRLRDKSGIIKVDTKEAGFVVTDVPVHATVTVSGVARREEGGEPYLAATGLRY